MHLFMIQFNNFFYSDRYSFPFGRPEGALKSTLSLLERVSSFLISALMSKFFLYFLAFMGFDVILFIHLLN